MNDSILKLIGLIIGYFIIKNFLFKKKKGEKLSFRRRYDLRKKKMTNEEN
tara:strand:+ start:49 stop:198 length:150 start_codon:yes stop_codon:yes gene_type:complete